MSDDDRDIDIESDDGDDSDSRLRHPNNTQYCSQAEKRAHHNALERKRRDHIKDSFSSLKNAVPTLQAEKAASRAQILKKAAEYIQTMRKKNVSQQQSIEDLKKQNSYLDAQISELLENSPLEEQNFALKKMLFLKQYKKKQRKRAGNFSVRNCTASSNVPVPYPVRSLEKAINSGNFTVEPIEVTRPESIDFSNFDTESESDTETDTAVRQPKKLKIGGH